MTSLQIIAAIIVGVVFPLYTIIYGGATRKMLLENPDKKIYIFQLTSIQLLILAAITIVPLVLGDVDLSEIGLDFLSDPMQIAAYFIASLLTLWLMYFTKVTAEGAEKLKKQYERVLYLLPANLREYRLMVFVSFVAGICEEIVYRGFLIWFLAHYMPLVPAVILSSLPFALAHLTTTGWQNTIAVFGLAMVFAMFYILTGSLWLSILLHTLVDLLSATRSYKAHQVGPVQIEEEGSMPVEH